MNLREAAATLFEAENVEELEGRLDALMDETCAESLNDPELPPEIGRVILANRYTELLQLALLQHVQTQGQMWAWTLQAGEHRVPGATILVALLSANVNHGLDLPCALIDKVIGAGKLVEAIRSKPRQLDLDAIFARHRAARAASRRQYAAALALQAKSSTE